MDRERYDAHMLLSFVGKENALLQMPCLMPFPVFDLNQLASKSMCNINISQKSIALKIGKQKIILTHH